MEEESCQVESVNVQCKKQVDALSLGFILHFLQLALLPKVHTGSS